MHVKDVGRRVELCCLGSALNTTRLCRRLDVVSLNRRSGDQRPIRFIVQRPVVERDFESLLIVLGHRIVVR